MADHQPLNATFFAFRKRERGGVLIGASLTYLILAVVIGGGFMLLNAQAFLDYIHWAQSMSANMGAATGKPGGAEAAVNAIMPPASVIAMGGWYMLFLIVYYVLLAAYEAACLRWMIHGETGGLMGLSLGADTWRVYFTYWVWVLLLFALYIVFFLLAGGVMVSVAAMSHGGAADFGSIGLASILICLALFLGLIYFGVRFAPASATSVARRKFSFFDAWAVSKGRFWALFGAYFLLLLMFMVFYMIFAVAAGFAMAGMIATMSGTPQTPEEAFRILANPQFLITIALFATVMIAASLTLYVAFFGVNARAAVAALEEGKIKPAE